MASRKKGSALRSQSRLIIYNIMQFMEDEAKKGSPTIPLKQVQKMVTAATKVM